jgi:hypothetical protein
MPGIIGSPHIPVRPCTMGLRRHCLQAAFQAAFQPVGALLPQLSGLSPPELKLRTIWLARSTDWLPSMKLCAHVRCACVDCLQAAVQQSVAGKAVGALLLRSWA